MKQLGILLLLITVTLHVHAQKSPVVFDHISLHVNNLERSVDFYSKLFNLDSIPDPFPQFRVTWFKIGNDFQMHLFEDKNPIPASRYHFCFSVPSLDDFIAKLNQYKIDFFDGSGKIGAITVRTDKIRQIYFKDPDGHKIEVNDAPH